MSIIYPMLTKGNVFDTLIMLHTPTDTMSFTIL